MSNFWKALMKLMGIHHKLLTSYHPETDGSSKHTNKMVVQCLHYHMERNQKGWVKALPKVRFDIMNTVNISTGLSPCMLKMGRSPCLLPPLPVEGVTGTSPADEAMRLATTMLESRGHGIPY